MVLRLFSYFCSLYLTVTTFCYFAFGKHVIETHGYMGGTATLNKFNDFLILCLGSCVFALIAFAIIYLIIAKSYQFTFKRELKLKPIHISLIYAVLWLAIATITAGGCAENWGNTWNNFEIFNFFVLGNAQIALPLLGTGIFFTLLIRKYL